MRIRLALMTVVALLFPAQAAQAEEVVPRIAVAYDIGFLGDGGFNDAVHQALKLAKKRYNLVEPYVREMPTSGTAVDRLTKLRFLAKSGYTLIITVGTGYRETVRRVSMEYPEVQFAPINDKTLAQLNISNIYFNEIEIARIAGMTAALKSKSKVIALIGGDSDTNKAFQEVVKQTSKKAKVQEIEFTGDLAKLASELGKSDIVYSLWDKDSSVVEVVLNRKPTTLYIGRNPDQYFARIGSNPKVIAVVEKLLTKPVATLVNLGMQDRALIDVIDEDLGIFGRSYGLKNGGIRLVLGSRFTALETRALRSSFPGLRIVTNQG